MGFTNPDHGVAIGGKLTSLTALNTLVDNVANGNTHEGWVGTNGSMKGRIDATRTFALGDTAGSMLAYGRAASNSGPNAGQERLYANWAMRSSGVDAPPTI